MHPTGLFTGYLQLPYVDPWQVTTEPQLPSVLTCNVLEGLAGPLEVGVAVCVKQDHVPVGARVVKV